jgi:hypothetical protein
LKKKRFFLCSGCFRPTFAYDLGSSREALNCFWCKSTSRERAIFLQIHKQFLLKKIGNPLRNPKILGVSDGYLTSTILTKLYGKKYTNYHYHLEPRLDITAVPLNLHETVDIISCSEVLEHVEPPIEKAFAGLSQLLRTNGKLILSVPHTDLNGSHIEHFPEMKNIKLSTREGNPFLEGESINGVQLEFTELTFHGGIGATLEFRIFSHNSLEQFLKTAGFRNIVTQANNLFFGICWEPWSRVWITKK